MTDDRDESFEGSGAAASRRLAAYLSEWARAPRKGCRSSGAHEGLTSIELRFTDAASDSERILVLEPVIREGIATIEVWERAPNGGGPPSRDSTNARDST